MSVFDDILETASDEEKTIAKEAVSKVAPLRKELERLDGYDTWFGEHWDPNALTTKNSVVAIRARDEQLSEKDKRIKELTEKQGQEMNWEDITKGLTEKGYVTKADVETSAKAAADAVKGEVFGTVEHVFASTAHLPAKHLKEWGEDLNMKSLMKFMSEKGVKDFDEGYKSYVAPKVEARNKEMEEKREEQFKEQLKAAEEKGKKDALKERNAQQENMPVDQTGQGEVGHLQARHMERVRAKEGEKLSNTKLGDGVAHEMLRKFREDQAGGQVN